LGQVQTKSGRDHARAFNVTFSLISSGASCCSDSFPSRLQKIAIHLNKPLKEVIRQGSSFDPRQLSVVSLSPSCRSLGSDSHSTVSEENNAQSNIIRNCFPSRLRKIAIQLDNPLKEVIRQGSSFDPRRLGVVSLSPFCRGLGSDSHSTAPKEKMHCPT
jgi:cell division protein ZapA (FtsZ GTPase activity inhibitor)